MTSGGWLTRIADAHAGLPDEPTAAQVLAAGDPGTRRVVDALGATRADLRALGRERMPVSLAGSLAAALDAVDDLAEDPPLSAGPAVRHGAPGADEIDGSSVGPADTARRAADTAPPAPPRTTERAADTVRGEPTHRPSPRPGFPRAPGRPRRRRGLVLTAAAAAVVGVVLTGPGPGPTDLAAATGRVLADRTREVGLLEDPARLTSCLVGAGAPAPAGPLLAGRPIRLNGAEGLLLVISTGERGVVRAVVVTPGCERVLADLTVGG